MFNDNNKEWYDDHVFKRVLILRYMLKYLWMKWCDVCDLPQNNPLGEDWKWMRPYR